MSPETILLFAELAVLLPLAGFVVSLLAPAAFKKVWIAEVFLAVLAMLGSGLVFYCMTFGEVTGTVEGALQWISLNQVGGAAPVDISVTVRLTSMNALMLFLVHFIGVVVHLYSITYMKGDARYNRYFAYLGLFIFAMSGIVITSNLFLLFIFWELVGFTSYLLIGFWYEKEAAADAARKAFIVNRIGDAGFLTALMLLFATYGSFDLSLIFEQVSAGVFPFGTPEGLTLAGILLFAGAAAKSAQLPLHVWLPDAMAGPTPVSALIHAATMVAAGVYLVALIYPLLTVEALTIIAYTGALTALMAASIALAQDDIKKILAFSTISQLGFMIMALGIGAYVFALFHLITHAFFKAGLFLAAGSVSKACNGELNIKRLGGLAGKLPFTYASFLIFGFSLAGVPMTAGFLSKDGILTSTYAFGILTGDFLLFGIGIFSALLTAVYIFRLIFSVFHGEGNSVTERTTDPPAFMKFTVLALAVLSLFVVFSLNPLDPQSSWLARDSITAPAPALGEGLVYAFTSPGTGDSADGASLFQQTIVEEEMLVVIISLLLALTGILIAMLLYFWRNEKLRMLVHRSPRLITFQRRKWYFDEVYRILIVKPVRILSRFAAAFDKKVIDGILHTVSGLTVMVSKIVRVFDTYVIDMLVNLTGFISGSGGFLLRKLQSGKVQSYLILALLSIFFLLFLL